MSKESIKYTLTSKLGLYDDLVFCYDFLDSGFSDKQITATGETSEWTGVFVNQSPSQSSGDYYALALDSLGVSEIDASGLCASFITSNGFDLSQSNLRLPSDDINLSNCSFIVDFSFDNNISSGILFGSYEKEEIQLPDLSYVTGSKGFNVGVTDRGHLFVNGYSKNGDFLRVFNNIELSKRNVISFGNNNDKFYISYLDFFADKAVTVTKNVNNFYIQSPEFIYFGGTNNHYEATQPENKTFNGYLNSVYGFSRKVSDIYNLFTGFASDYQYESGENVFYEYQYLSGENLTYQTGVTGYQENIFTGNEYTGHSEQHVNYNITGTDSVQEGSHYLFLDSGVLLDVGYLDPSIENFYSPTGSSAFDTIGLLNNQTSVNLYEKEETIEDFTGEYSYVEFSGITGAFDSVESSEVVYGNTGFYEQKPDSSGLYFNLSSSDFKKDFLYYKGD